MIKTFKCPSSIVATVIYLSLSLLSWLMLAPIQFGGSVTYVIVRGNSMEPEYRLGDLLLVRKETSYQVGDAVAYQDKELGKLVFHRILRTELDRFILKGDNNSWIDSYSPSQDEIVGKLWLHVPKFGKAIEWVRVPLHMALTISILGGFFMSGMMMKSPSIQTRGVRWMQKFRGSSEGGIYLFSILTLVFLALAIISFVRPAKRTADNISYQQEGTFSYSAIGMPGIYDSDMVRSGEPVFLKLSCLLDVGFTYNLLGAQMQDISGSYQLVARVLDKQSGWQRTIPLNQETPFTGNTYTSSAQLDLCLVASLVNLVEKETGLHPNIYTLEIINQAAFTGIIAGKQASDTFDSSLVFNFDKALFYLASNNTPTDPLHSVKESLLNHSDLSANTFSIFGLQPTVLSVRLIALFGIMLSLIGLFAFGLNVYYLAQQSQVSLIKLKYDSMLVDVYEGSFEPTSNMTDVASMDDLAKLAERQRSVILHMPVKFLHYYFVQNNGTTYRYVISARRKGILESDLVCNESHESVEDIINGESQPDHHEIVKYSDHEDKTGIDTRLSETEI